MLGLSIVPAHELMIRLHHKRFVTPGLLVLYLILGSTGGQFVGIGWMAGTIFGAMQWIGILPVLAIHGRFAARTNPAFANE